ncbi:COIL [Linum perenne]
MPPPSSSAPPMDAVRLRLVFDQVLAESLKKKTNGLKRFWVLLKPQHKTISDLSRYLLDVFDLHNASPQGLLLSMEGFYLPPFESSCVLKDRDIVRVKRKGGECCEIGNGELNAGAVKFLANEEFEKEAGGYESDDPEEEDCQLEDGLLHVEETPVMTKVCKKRKASDEPGSSKYKKKKKKKEKEVNVLACSSEKRAVDSEDNKTVKKDGKTAEEGIQKTKKSSERNQCSTDHVDASCSPSGDKKVPSRSARRKKAKRQWLKELRRAEKEKEEKHLSAIPNGKASQKKNRKAIEEPREEEEQQLPLKPNKKANRKNNHKASRAPVEKNMHTSKPAENDMHTSEPVEEDIHTSVEEVPDNSEKVPVDDEQPDQNSDKDDEIVPIVIRPGHIRFEPLEKASVPGSADPTNQQNQALVDTSQWNGMSKKKGQKWGKQNSESWKWTDNGNSSHKPSETWKENASSSHSETWNHNANPSRKPSETQPLEEDTHVYNHIDFDKLAPYASSPKEGDIIAYRLIQLSSSWTPELSTYLVGKISQFNPQYNNIKLVSVPKYSLIPQNNEEDDETLPETCALQEDGSLEMDFSSLVEVRAVKCTNPVVSSTAVETSAIVRDTPAKGTKNRPSDKGTDDATNSWDEISQALSAKKAELSQEHSWNKPQKGAGVNQRTVSVKPWRGSALGPTMALLRAQNGL